MGILGQHSPFNYTTHLSLSGLVGTVLICCIDLAGFHNTVPISALVNYKCYFSNFKAANERRMIMMLDKITQMRRKCLSVQISRAWQDTVNQNNLSVFPKS